MNIKFCTVGDALALIEESSEVYISFVAEDPGENDCVFSGQKREVPYWVTCLPLDHFNGVKTRSFYSISDDGANGTIGILCKKPVKL